MPASLALAVFCLVCFTNSTAAGAIEVSHPQHLSNTNQTAATIFREGKSALAAGDLQHARDCFQKVLALDPKSSAAHTNIGVTYMREKRWTQAMQELYTADRLTPGQPGIQLNLGLTYYRQNQFESAINPLSEAVANSTDATQPRLLLGYSYFFINRFQEAIQILSPLWTSQQDNLNFLYVLSIAASKAGDRDLQEKAFAKLLETGRDKPEFHLYLGKAWLAQHDTGKALTEFQTAASQHPGLPMIHYFIGRTYLEQRLYAEAELELRASCKTEPDFAYAYEDLGILFLRLNRPLDAEHYFHEAVTRNTSLVNSYQELAKLYLDQQRLPTALSMSDRALQLAPTSASVHFTRGQILKASGQTAAAKREFETTASLHKAIHDRSTAEPSADQFADAQAAAQE